MEINGTDVHEWAIEEVATQFGIAAITVRYRIEHGDDALRDEVENGELYWRERENQ
jgi:DNA-directed RNA polymerase specialized sigma24 family protein